jgi:hypothetical protein
MFHVEQVEASSMNGVSVWWNIGSGSSMTGGLFHAESFAWVGLWTQFQRRRLSSPRPRKTFHVERSASDDFYFVESSAVRIHAHCFAWNNLPAEIGVRYRKLRGWILAVAHQYKSPQ